MMLLGRCDGIRSPAFLGENCDNEGS